MKKISKKMSMITILVSFFLGHSASGKQPENKVLSGTIQYPSTLEVPISPTTIVYRGDPVLTQVDQKNHAISFQLLRPSSQFTFKLLIAEPQNIEHVPYESKYHTEATNTFKYQRIKEGEAYRYFMLTLVPSITDSETKRISYSWSIHENRITNKERKIPDDAIVMHSVPDWISHLDGNQGFDFPTIWMKTNLVEIAGSSEKVKETFMHLALASMDSGALRGKKVDVAMKREGNRIIHAALPMPAA